MPFLQKFTIGIYKISVYTEVDYYVVRNANDKLLNRIELTLDKTEYALNEEISGLVVTAYDNDGTNYLVTNYETDFNSSTVGDKNLTVTYQEKTATVAYKVVDNSSNDDEDTGNNGGTTGDEDSKEEDEENSNPEDKVENPSTGDNLFITTLLTLGALGLGVVSLKKMKKI